MEAFNRTGDPLVIVGKGPEEKKLKKLAKKNITFKRNVPQDELVDLYQNAAAFVFAGVEDFGIAFVEAQACGIPVMAYKKGGVMDIVNENTGVLFESQSIDDITKAIEKIKKTNFPASNIRQNSLKFSSENFKKNFENYLEDTLEKVKQEKDD